ncbi:peptide chain release factor N(5)-glutamine methyltransferase [bacterium]|nr:peptide chain release factor N(5)-glutamine methyltransferase [bacterium]
MKPESNKIPVQKKTLRELFIYSLNLFKNWGIPNCRREIELILCDALRISPSKLYLSFSDNLPEPLVEKILEQIGLRLQRVPLAYITGRVFFWNLELDICPGVFIPRPETERLVEETLLILNNKVKEQEVFNIIEIGTGSGAICCALATAFENVYIRATEINPRAIEIANRNIEKFNLQDKINIFQGNIFQPLQKLALQDTVDIVVANLPYIRSGDIETLQPEVRDHEPLEALDGGPDGLTYQKKVIRQAIGFLRRKGTILLEIGYDQGKEMLDFTHDLDKYIDLIILKDYSNIDRVFKATLK